MNVNVLRSLGVQGLFRVDGKWPRDVLVCDLKPGPRGWEQ